MGAKIFPLKYCVFSLILIFTKKIYSNFSISSLYVLSIIFQLQIKEILQWILSIILIFNLCFDIYHKIIDFDSLKTIDKVGGH